MKKLLLICAVLFSFAAWADVVVSPGCPPPQVTVGGGLPTDPCAPFVEDPRRANIRGYWEAYAIYPTMVMDAMIAFGVDYDELENAINYKVDVINWLRYNKAPATLIKTWDDASIDQIITWIGGDLTDKWERVNVQDQLDLAARREALYNYYGIPIPDSIAPWKHPRPEPIPAPPPCVGNNCPVVSP